MMDRASWEFTDLRSRMTCSRAATSSTPTTSCARTCSARIVASRRWRAARPVACVAHAAVGDRTTEFVAFRRRGVPRDSTASCCSATCCRRSTCARSSAVAQCGGHDWRRPRPAAASAPTGLRAQPDSSRRPTGARQPRSHEETRLMTRAGQPGARRRPAPRRCSAGSTSLIGRQLPDVRRHPQHVRRRRRRLTRGDRRGAARHRASGSPARHAPRRGRARRSARRRCSRSCTSASRR